MARQAGTGRAGVVEFLAAHPYLMASLAGSAVALMAVALAGRHRGSVLAAAGIEALHTPFVVLFDGVYWTPVRLGDVSPGIEDLLVCLSLGAGAWACAILPWRQRVTCAATPAAALLRLLWVMLLPMAAAIALRAAGVTVMGSLVAGTVIAAAVLLWRRPDLWRLPAVALAIYVPYYVCFLALCFWLIPGFAAMWDGPEVWGPRPFGLPVDELAWVASFALGFPLLIGTVLGVRIAPR